MSRTRRSSTVDHLVEHFGRSVPGEPGTEDLGNLHLILTVRRDVYGADLRHWQAGDLRELLLDVFPAKVAGDESLLRDGPRVLGQYLDHLAQAGALRGASIAALRAELAEAAQSFAVAMSHGSQRSMGGSLVSSMAADGVDLGDAAAVQQWIDDFNTRPFDERVELTGGPRPSAEEPGPPAVLPAVTVAPQDELRRAASSAPLVQRVRALLERVGPTGIAVTSTGALRLVDAKALAAACGDEGRLLRPEPWEEKVRRMADLRGVQEAYELAHLARLLHLTATRVRLGEAAGVDDLAMVVELAGAALEIGVFVDPTYPAYQDLVDAVGDEIVDVLAELYVAGEPCSVDELAGGVAEQIGVQPDGGAASAASTVRAYVERVFERFERLGVVERLGVHLPPDRAFLGRLGDQTTSVRLTPLGVWWLQQVLTASGLRAPVRGALSGATAAELCDGVAELLRDDGEDEVRAWSAVRDHRAAARELAGLLADPDAVRRHFALHVLDDLVDVSDEVRPLLEDPTARPYARMWLESHFIDVPERYRRAEDELLLFVDTASVLIGLGAVDELVQQLSAVGEPMRQAELVRQLWRVDHAATEPVLTALADAAPAPVSKAARKALHSLRSARAVSR